MRALFVVLGVVAILNPNQVMAATPAAAAAEVVREVVRAMEKAEGGRPELVVLTGVEMPEGDGVAITFVAAMQKSLTQDQGIRLVEASALKAALEEASLTMAVAGAVAEVAGALGAEMMITGTVVRSGDGYVANIRALSVEGGAVVASAQAAFSAGGDEEASVEATTIEVQLRRLSDRLAHDLNKLDGELRYQRIAVMPFEEVGSTTQDKQLGVLVSAELTTFFHRDHDLLLVERSKLAEVINELSLGQSGLVDESKAVEAGKLAGAQGLVIGSVSEAGDRYLVDARVVSVANGEVLAAEQMPLPAADLVALSSEAVVLRTRTGAIYRSLLLPGWGQLYNRQPIKGGVFVGAEVLAGVLAVVFHMQGVGYADKYDNKVAGTPQSTFDRLAENEQSSYVRRNWAIGAVVAVHLANVLDAFLSGKSFDSAEIGSGSSALATF